MGAVDPHSAQGRPSPLLVGRDCELRILRENLTAALTGRGSLVLISGEAGIGKTALAEALCREAEARGALVLIGRCFDLSETPLYGPWLYLFERYLAAPDLPPPPVAFAQPGILSDVPSPGALFRQVRTFLEVLATLRPAILLLDDLHWADPASLDLLRFLARTITTLPILLLITYRMEEVTRSHPLYTLLPTLVREAQPERLSLHPLDDPAVRALVTTRYRLTAADTDRLVCHLQAHAEGNAFFLNEILRTLEETGALEHDTQRWRLGDTGVIAVPTLVRQVIDGRLARLDEASQQLLAVAAVIGHAVSLDVWATVADRSEDVIADAVERGVSAQLLVQERDGAHVQFTHALVREAIYAGISAVRRRRLHRRIGEVLIEQAHTDPDAVAHHFRHAGDDRAVPWLIAAAAQAQSAAAWVTAADRYEAAASLLPATRVNAGERGWLLVRAGWLRRFADVPAAITIFEEASRLAIEANDRALTAYASFRLGGLLCRAPSLRRGLDILERGVVALDTLPTHERARLGSTLGERIPWDGYSHWSSLVMSLALAGRYVEALAIGERNIAAADATPEQTTRPVSSDVMSTYYGLGLVYAALGKPTEACAAFARSRSDRGTADNSIMNVAITSIQELAWVVLSYQADRVAERRAFVEQLHEALMRARDILSDDHYHRLAYATLWVLEGRWADARSVAIHSHATAGVATMRMPAIHALIALSRYQGEGDRARALVADWFPAGPSTAPGDTLFLDSLLMQRYAAQLALDKGDLATAHAWLEAHDRWLTWSSAVLGLAEGHTLWAYYYRVAGDADRAREHAERALAHATAPQQTLALLAAHRLLGELDTETERYNDAARHLNESLALADACAAPYERALTLLAMAEHRAACGQVPEARTLLGEVRAICAPLNAQPTLARVDALITRLDARTRHVPMYPAGLSEREVQVLRLVAAGRSNQEIADSLFLSAHTVRHHLTHILAKTDAANRAEATAFALRHGLA